MNRMAEPDMREALKPLLRGRYIDALVDFLLNSAMYDSSLVKHFLIAFSDDVQSLLHHWGSRLGTAVSQLTQNLLVHVSQELTQTIYKSIAVLTFG